MLTLTSTCTHVLFYHHAHIPQGGAGAGAGLKLGGSSATPPPPVKWRYVCTSEERVPFRMLASVMSTAAGTAASTAVNTTGLMKFFKKNPRNTQGTRPLLSDITKISSSEARGPNKVRVRVRVFVCLHEPRRINCTHLRSKRSYCE